MILDCCASVDISTDRKAPDHRLKETPLALLLFASFHHARQHYWILGVRNFIRMEDFRYYAGPIAITESKGRTPHIGKVWFVIFVCLATKAMHLRVVSDFKKKAFIAAFKSFCARRNNPVPLQMNRLEPWNQLQAMVHGFW
ncbi:uncharacterized protein LOC119561984 [Drosophila subpulchrella]|uniref:uncharacterized protein LOC119561984 n=1 Tax=Drosophila subpulchrella TaxID=1486046 RepID=UPI0018A16C06|nr:uncharacterized protein LOC119561984 [Drosophila subpulchrella]